MKKIVFGLLAASLLTGSLTGCNKKLDVEPIDSIDAGTALQTSNDVQGTLVGAYTGLQSNQAYGGYIQFMSDLLADDGDIEFVGTFIPPQQIQRKAILKDNGFVESIWVRGYNTVNRTNNVLANLDKLDTPAKKTRVEGEAKFIRSLVFFDLVRLYARAWNDGTPANNPGIPLVITPTTTVSSANQVARNTVAEVYNQIITDLTTAEAKLPAITTPVNFNLFATREAASALLARVYLQQGRYAEAAAAANRTITRFTGVGGTLNANYGDNFTANAIGLAANTVEDIFSIQYSVQSGLNDLNTFYSASQRGDVSVNDQLLNQFESGDDRSNIFVSIPNQILSTKYDGQYGNIKLFRLSEMLLTRAEANFRAGTAVGASPLADINLIRTRALLPALTSVSLPVILKERKLELLFEGFRLGDLKRNQESTVDPASGASIPWNSPRLVFPIPLREINANPKLVQNPGY